MSDTDTSATQPLAGGKPPAKRAPAPVDYAALTDEQVLRARENAFFARKLAADDAKRAAAPDVVMIAITGFIMHDDPEHEDGRIINRGDEFTISQFDLPKFMGKGRMKAIDTEEQKRTAGVSITTGA